MRPKKSQLMPIVIGAAALGAYLMFGKSSSQAPAPSPGPAPNPPQPVPPQQDHVMQTTGGLMTTGQAQVMLKTLGGQAGDSAMSSLAIDGAWGPLTSTAVRHYQQIKGIAATGEIDAATGQTLAADYNAYIASGGKPAT
jgi:peptidoglycan hydrolase-like protein with peptidoglycan-binding domain